MKKSLVLLVAAVAAIAPACSSEPATQASVGDPACDNLDESACLLPFPSDFFRKEGGPYGQAHHLDFGPKMPMQEETEVRVDPKAFEAHDGFPIVPAITFALEGASTKGAPSLEDVGASTRADSKTLIIDTTTGALVPHWAELDYQAEDAGKRVVQLRVADALAHDRRYVVAVRRLVDDGGRLVPATRGFAALRDKTRTNVAGIDERRVRFEAEIFGVLEKLHVDRADLQLAWDFTTTTERDSTSRLLTVADRLYAAIGDDGPEYRIDQTIDDPAGPSGPIATILEATAKVPSFVLPEVIAEPRRLRLDAQGLPTIDGTIDVKFRIQIPRVAITGNPSKVAVMQYGHGFLGGDDEADTSWLRTWSNRHGFLILSTNMQGMTTASGVVWYTKLPNDMTNMAYLSEEPLQGIANHLALQRLVKGRLLREPLLQRKGEPIFDPARLYYHGNSQGGTMGNLVVLPSRDVKRAVLGVPGVSIGFILARAVQWGERSASIARGYSDPFELASLMSLVSVAWDKTDGVNFAPLYARLPGIPPKQLLLQSGLEDAQVSNDVTRLLARLYQARLVDSSPKDVWGLAKTAPPITGANALQEVDYGVPPRSRTNRPAPRETDTHGKTRQLGTMQDQSWHFLETGEVIGVCNGVCDPD